MSNLQTLKIKRCIIPEDAESTKARLICLSDAAANAGGTAIYASFKTREGKYKNQLLMSRSKLMSMTIPRNKLDGILLMSETAFLMHKALKDHIKQIIYITDSTIALCWAHSENKRMKPYVANQVDAIKEYITSTTSQKEIPLYHIQGERNISDLLTRKRDITLDMINDKSKWQIGPTWMEYELDQI